MCYDILKCVLWNVKGWSARYKTDNHFIRETCEQKCGLDIKGIAETHLKSNETLFVQCFKWVGQNRETLHTKAEKGCGDLGWKTYAVNLTLKL